MRTNYSRGDAAAFGAWLEHQPAEIASLAARFKPWEIYKLQGREIYVHVVDYDVGEKTELLHVQYLDPSYGGDVITVVPHQIDLWGVVGLDALPDNQQRRPAKVA